MSSSPKLKPLSEFTRLNDIIAVYKPPLQPNRPASSPSPSSTPQEPSLVILCTWLGGATSRRISTYTRTYQRLLPHASILLIQTTTADMTYRSIPAQHSRMLPARDYVSNFLASQTRAGSEANNRTLPLNGPGQPILLHMLSSGGANTACILAFALEETSTPLPRYLMGIIHDCNPGMQDFWRGFDSLRVSLAKSSLPVRVIGTSTSFISMVALQPLMKTGAIKGMDFLREKLLELLGTPGEMKGTKRLYMWSRGDRVIDWTAVSRHAEDARKMGFEVEERMFEQGEHCALPMANGKEYWDEIRELWKGEKQAEIEPKEQGVLVIKSKL
ncbi:hypothetical protein BJ875DRAFT_469951 [Amylocarpus encephaloides]|uniref:Indole-diterpene biosynthesis protein PaxU n=1 Tax=Amylocarpus encephaloides TaxID=45428 RepID=A0A9P8C3T3_9HELO|nr:hypothetical protein BJ875DRAFT_469951 [Amylocarpus encephaloides]